MHFVWRNKDKKCTTIDVDLSRCEVRVENHTDNILETAFGVNINPSLDDLDDFLEGRCFPRARANCNDILAELGIDEYDPLEIVMKTHGLMRDDYYWIDFGGGVKYDDIKIRD